MGDYEKYLRMAEEWEAEFTRNRARYGPKIHCRNGCSDCCGQMFQITELEAAYISHGVKGLPEARQAALKERARTYLEKRKGLIGSQGIEEAWGSLPPPGLRLPCPALEGGACSIYEHRPMICRKYGIPLHNPKKPDRIFACELNFQPGEEIQDDQLVQIHTGLYQRWADVQADYNDQGGRRDPKPLTVARAILEDFEPYLPGRREARDERLETSDE
ncbi:MAG TPA: YkgJ family cysteine cluster protein [Terriglobia bacterium]|nr:YkgJ family cysteine cluster protein [Terriglobia bacterium]